VIIVERCQAVNLGKRCQNCNYFFATDVADNCGREISSEEYQTESYNIKSFRLDQAIDKHASA